MKYTLIGIIVITCFLITNKTLSEANAEHYIAQVATTTPTRAPKIVYKKSSPTQAQIDLINKKAEQYNVSAKLITEVISCESDFNPQARGDGGYSRGLVQIHALYHPDITYEQATNEEFAIDFLAKNLSEGKGYLWSCYRLITSR